MDNNQQYGLCRWCWRRGFLSGREHTPDSVNTLHSNFQGDSGGPLSLPVNNQHVLAGIVSWGHPDGCALVGKLLTLFYITISFNHQANMYGVYAETAKFKTWLDNNMAANGGMTKCLA